MINAVKLKELLECKDESPKLEFKLKYEFSGQDKGKRQDEFAKDLLALANTAGRAADDYAYLIVGAGDRLRADGTRAAEDVRPFDFKPEQFLSIANARCAPPVRNIEYEVIEHAGNFYGVIEIPPSPFVHELTRNLDTPKGSWQRGSVLIRRGSEIGTASPGELKLMEREKESWSGAVTTAAAPRTALEQLEELLPDPHKNIAVRKLMIAEARTLHAALNEPNFLAADCHQRKEPLVERIGEYEELTTNLLELFVTGCYHGDDLLDALWADALTVVADTSDTGGCADMMLRLRRYPALLLFYAGGIAAIAGHRYKTLAALFHRTKVRRWAMIHKAAAALPPATVVDRYDRQYLNQDGRHAMPLELHLRNRLREPLRSVVHTEDEYLDCFTRFEYFFALNSLANNLGVIAGSYMWESEIHRKFRQSYFRDSVPAISETNAEIELKGADWLPFKSGVFFSGSYEQFFAFKAEADKKIIERARNFIITKDY